VSTHRLSSIRWCALSREGWCATVPNRRTPDSADSVKTLCQHHIVLPGGSERREPTCPDCLAVIKGSLS
jgi:hypothetical protein